VTEQQRLFADVVELLELHSCPWRWRRRALTPLNRQIKAKNGLRAGRLQNFAA
jgi:hypothetical protein